MFEPPSTTSGDRTFGHTSASETEGATIEGVSTSWGAPEAEASDLPTGASLGRYTILSRLGSGAMGVVYSAFDPDLDRKVAIKLLHSRTNAVSSGEEGKLRLLREAKALARLSHPNVVSIHDVGTFGERIFLAMEFVDGETLGVWLKKRRRPWKECVDIMIKAGEGLAAAHRGGLIHRDFKPDNVVLGHDGRVRVLDFGLARASDDMESQPADYPVDASASIKVEITTTGVLVGTPAYMSPEQHIGRSADARSDIFSFCVTFYQVLYGERPYEGNNLSVLASNVIQGKIRQPPGGTTVPAWLHKLILQGLSIDPEKRFPSMEVLLERLRRDPLRIRTRWLGVVAVAALSLGIGVGTLGAERESPCQGAAMHLEGIWDDERKLALEQAFIVTGVPYAETAWQSTATALDAYGEAWVGMHTDACEATLVRTDQSEEMLDLRMLCLDRRLGELQALTDAFVEATPTAVENAREGVSRLPDLDPCGDREALMETVAPPSDPEARKVVGQIRASLAQAKAKDITGKWALALELANDAVVAADRVDYPPVKADALLVVAGIQQQLGEHSKAMATLQQAAELAAGARYDEVVAVAWIESINVAAIRQSNYERALWAGQAAEVAIRRVEGGAEGAERTVLRARLDLNLARALQGMGSAEAASKAKQALETFENELGEDHPMVHKSLTVLALAALGQRRYKEAEAHLNRALTIATRVSGSEHPSVAAVLNNLAEVVLRQGKATEALALVGKALAIREKVLAPDHAALAKSLFQAASIETRLGRLDDAALHLARAIEIYDKDPVANAPHRGESLNNLAMLHIELGDMAAAKVDFRGAIEAFTQAYGDEHPYTASARVNLGERMILDGDVAGGLSLVETGIEHLRADNPKNDMLAFALMITGMSRLDSGDYSDAEVRLRESLAIYSELSNIDPEELARARFAMARTLRALERGRSEWLTLAVQAAQEVEGEGEGKVEGGLKAEIDRWIVAQGR